MPAPDELSSSTVPLLMKVWSSTAHHHGLTGLPTAATATATAPTTTAAAAASLATPVAPGTTDLGRTEAAELGTRLGIPGVVERGDVDVSTVPSVVARRVAARRTALAPITVR